MTAKLLQMRPCLCGDPRGPKCPDCQAHEQEGQEKRRGARRKASQLPVPLQGLGIEDLKVRSGQVTAVEAARAWATHRYPGSLVLTGEVGRGKSLIAAAACWTRLENWPCKYASVSRCMAQLGGSFSDHGRQEAVRFFSGTGDAVLDDFDKCRVTDFGKEQLFAAVDGRQQAGSALLVTTNLTPDEIGQTFGDALMSRLSAPYCRVVEVGGPDHRVEGK